MSFTSSIHPFPALNLAAGQPYVFAEDNGIPYIFVSSKEELARACMTKRPTSCVLIVPTMKVRRIKSAGVEDTKEEDYTEIYKEVVAEVKVLVRLENPK